MNIRLICGAWLLMILNSCGDTVMSGKFQLKGEISNIADQQIYLDQVFFDNRPPEVLDTADVRSGKFSLEAKAPEEGLYRIRFQTAGNQYFFIGSKGAINFKADADKQDLDGFSFSGSSNADLKSLMKEINRRQIAIGNLDSTAKALQNSSGNDSMIVIAMSKLDQEYSDYKQFLLRAADTCSNPNVSMFALGFTSDITPSLVDGPVKNLARRFPDHEGVKAFVAFFDSMMESNKQKKMASGAPDVGSLAPDFTLNDVNGKPLSLSSFKGKYVLVDFWASWCGPCRGENPNVVNAYKRFKDKNFTILGVSLDENRDSWIKAISDDNLTWSHVSDLKYWNSSVVSLYKFDGIPYNVLVDPEGKIIASNLRGEMLSETLEQYLR